MEMDGNCRYLSLTFICQKLLLNITKKMVENAFDLMCQNLITIEEIIP